MKTKKGNLFIKTGLLLIGAALLITVYNVYENYNAKKSSEYALMQLREQIAVAENNTLDKNTTNNKPLYESYEDMYMPEISINGANYVGVLSVPVLGLELPVKGEFSYKALLSAPCRYYGSVYKDNMIIAAHNYASHFGYLGRLNIGDEVDFTDGDGNVFAYSVAEIYQIDGTDVREMKSGEWDMTLFTCNVSGNKRITVRLEKIN